MELQPNPVFVVHVSALVAAEHDPTASAVGEALPAVAFPTTVLVACVARLVNASRPVAVSAVVTVRLDTLGAVASTGEPEPVAAFANPAATPAPRPLTPVEIGSPVRFVATPDAGVPSAGEVSVRPAIVVTVAPLGISVEPSVGAA